MTKRALVLLGMMAAGCAGQGSSSTSSAGELTVEEHQGQASGYFIDHSEADLGRVDFTSRFVDTNVLDIELRFHGLTVTSLVDFDSGVVEYDGFATGNGADTQILDDDRALMQALAHALDARGTTASEPLQRVRSFANTWAEFPATLDPQGISLVDEHRYNSICWAVNTYYRATHDCWSGAGDCSDWWGCSRGNDNSTLDYAYISMHSDCPAADGTNFWNNNTWQCYESDHSSSVEYAYGGCFGRCGAGCGSSTQFTQDCADHDECVRTGHDLASAWCDDEFTDTVDDWAVAPNC